MIFFNDQLSDQTDCISILDRGFIYGDGVFTTTRVQNGMIENAELHWERLARHAAVLKLPALSLDRIANGAAELIATLDQTKTYSLRVVLTRGVSARGLDIPLEQNPNLILSASELNADFSAPLRLIKTDITRRNEFSPLAQIKSLNYADNILAKDDAKTRGADDAILLNTRGHVTCATSSNIFIREVDKWFTPPLSDGVMDGVERFLWLKSGAAREDQIDYDRLKNADEIMVTNSIWRRRPAVLI